LKFCNKILLKEEGQHRSSILLGTWNRNKHIEWLNTNPKKKQSGNIRDRQYRNFIIILFYFNYLDLFHYIIRMVIYVH